MSVREVPKSFVYTCDECNGEHVQENANGHYHNSCPPEWTVVTIFKHGGGCPPKVHLMCPVCAQRMSANLVGTTRLGDKIA